VNGRVRSKTQREINLKNLNDFQCASENDNNYYGDVDDTDDDGSVWWNSDERDCEIVRVSVPRKFVYDLISRVIVL